MDGSEIGRAQVRIPEFVKKLHPDVLRNRFRHFRKFVITTVTDRKSNVRETGAASTSGSSDRRAEECDRVHADQDGSLWSKFSRRSSRGKRGRECPVEEPANSGAGNGDRVDRRLSADEEMDVPVPDVIVLKDETAAGTHSSRVENGSSNPLQLTIDVEAPSARNKSPVTVQEWVDSLPLTPDDSSRDECDIPITIAVPVADPESDTLTLGAEAGHLCSSRKTSVSTPPVNVTVTSCHEPSEVESHCSSVDSLLEARKPDPEEILLSLGFGGTASTSYLETGRVPKRFLSPSQLKGVDIDEFIRQQQDLIYTFESGYYGYRGLAGPSHSSPSVIVAKILEKLRDHEKETTSMTSFHSDFKKRSSVDQLTTEGQPKKFSKVARNVLTKIRCTPGSVLSPDNRRWLDSQGNKSPEIARRLIIGQKSFTFGHDGDLIESSVVGNATRNEPEQSTQNNDINGNFQPDEQTRLNVHEVKPKPEPSDCNDEERTANSRLDRNATETSTDLSLESIIMKTDDSKYGSRDQEMNDTGEQILNFRDLTSSTPVREKVFESDSPDSCSPHFKDRKSSSSSSSQDDKLTNAASLPECEVNASTKPTCLRDELKDSAENSPTMDVNQNPVKKTRNILTRCSSFEESARENSDDESSVKYNPVSECRSSERTDNFSDSATESEFASYPHRTLLNKNIIEHYEELVLLQYKLQELGRPIVNITEEQFSSLSAEQQCALQCRVIRSALEVYLNQLREDEINLELKNCLTAEARKVADLLDGVSDINKLSVIVRQVTLLLQQQRQLSAQIKELSVVEKKPSSCHEMCDHILKRVQELELLVQQNAQELAHMKYQLLNKK